MHQPDLEVAYILSSSLGIIFSKRVSSLPMELIRKEVAVVGITILSFNFSFTLTDALANFFLVIPLEMPLTSIEGGLDPVKVVLLNLLSLGLFL